MRPDNCWGNKFLLGLMVRETDLSARLGGRGIELLPPSCLRYPDRNTPQPFLHNSGPLWSQVHGRPMHCSRLQAAVLLRCSSVASDPACPSAPAILLPPISQSCSYKPHIKFCYSFAPYCSPNKTILTHWPDSKGPSLADLAW